MGWLLRYVLLEFCGMNRQLEGGKDRGIELDVY